MKPKIIVGILLIGLGVVALVYQGISYTTEEKVVELGPLEVTHEDEKTVPLPPILGIVGIAGGVALLAFSRK